jgi:hypothetical protein
MPSYLDIFHAVNACIMMRICASEEWTLTFQAHERYLKLQEQGKTEQSKKDLGEVISLNLDTWNGERVPSIS